MTPEQVLVSVIGGEPIERTGDALQTDQQAAGEDTGSESVG